MLDGPSQEDEQVSEALVLFHGVSLDLIELNSEHLHIHLDVRSVQGGIIWHFDGELLEFFEESVVDGFLVLYLLDLHSLLKCYYN